MKKYIIRWFMRPAKFDELYSLVGTRILFPNLKESKKVYIITSVKEKIYPYGGDPYPGVSLCDGDNISLKALWLNVTDVKGFPVGIKTINFNFIVNDLLNVFFNIFKRKL